jgi:hypothetical protein
VHIQYINYCFHFYIIGLKIELPISLISPKYFSINPYSVANIFVMDNDRRPRSRSMDVYFNRVSIPGVVKLLNFQAKKSALFPFYCTVHISHTFINCLSVQWVKKKKRKKKKMDVFLNRIFINGVVCG